MIFFIEYLTVRTWFGTVLPLLFQPKNRSRKVRCYFIEGSRWGILLARLTAVFNPTGVEELKFRLIDIRDEEGLLLRLRIAYQDLAQIQSEIFLKSDVGRFLDELPQRTRLKQYIAKSMVTINLERQTLWRALLIIHACVWALRQTENENYRGTLVMDRRPLLSSIEQYSTQQGITIIPVRSMALDLRSWIIWCLRPRGVFFLKWLRDRLIHLRFHLKGKSLSRAESSECPRVAVEYTGHLNLNKPECYSDLFFVQESSLQGSDVVMTFGIPQDPLNSSRLNELSDEGVASVVLDARATSICEAPLFVYRPPLTSGVSHNENGCQGIDKTWLNIREEEYWYQRAYWAKLFELTNTRLSVTWYRYDSSHCAIADAIASLDGVAAVYQRAIQLDPSPEVAVDSDIMFGFSPADASVEARSGSIIPYHVSVGYFGDHRFSLLKPQAEIRKTQLLAKGAEFILAYFDENSGDDPRWHTGHEFMQANYAFLLEKVLAEPWFGLVIKPKRPASLRRRLGPVSDLLQSALKTGRVELYETGVLHGSQPPIEAALAADVAVHGHLCAATAGSEAALAGVPTLLLDREGWHRSPLYRLGENVVFTDWASLWDAVLTFKRDPTLTHGFGDWSSMLDELDPFRDGRAAERLGDYLKWLLEAMRRGEKRETVLAGVADRYAAQWGHDKITEVCPLTPERVSNSLDSPNHSDAISLTSDFTV